MIRLSTLKPFRIGRGVYVLNEKPDMKGTVVYPLVDSDVIYDATIYDIFVDCSRISFRQTQCCYVPKRLITKIDAISIRETFNFNDIRDRIMKKFKNIKRVKFVLSTFNGYNVVHESELVLKTVRDRVYLNNDSKFKSFIDIIFSRLAEYTNYDTKIILVPLDYVKVPLSKAKYLRNIYKDRDTSVATLLLLFMKLYPKEFIDKMIQTQATLLFYSKNGVFRLSHKDITESVVVSREDGSIGIEDRKNVDANYYDEAYKNENPSFRKLYSEAYTVQEDKLIDATIVALRRLKGEGELELDDDGETIEHYDDYDDAPLEETKYGDDEDLTDAINDAILDDNTVEDADTPEVLQFQTDDVHDSEVVLGIGENGAPTNVRVKEIKTTKQNAKNIQSQHQAKIINKLTDENSSEEEIKAAEELGEALVNSTIDNQRALRSAKKLKEIKLNRTRVLSPKEKRFLKRIESTTIEDEIQSLDDMQLPETVLKNVDSFDDIGTNKFMNFNTTYEKKFKKKDLEATLNHFAYVDDFPIYQTGWKIEDTSTKFDHKETLKVQFKDADGKAQTITLDRPLLHDGNKMKINGTNLELQSQKIVKPIVLFNGSVMFSMNYNKAFGEISGKYCSRYESMIARMGSKVLKEPELRDSIKTMVFGNADEGDEIQRTFYFDRFAKNMFEKIYKDDNNFIDFRNSRLKEIFGDKFNSDDYMIVGKYNGVELKLNKELDTIQCDDMIIPTEEFIFKVLSEWESDEVVKVLSGLNKNSTLAHSIIKIMSKKIPFILLLSYTEGLDVVLERSGVDYELIYEDKKPSYDVLKYDVIRFHDCWLKYSIASAEHAILFSGLQQYDLSQFRYDEFCDTDKGVASEFISELGNGNLPLYVTSFKMCFVDPISKSILRDYGLPTEFLDVMLYGNMLLASDVKMSDADMRLYRIRSAEIIEALTYKVLADAYVNYHIAKKRGSKHARLEIPRDAVMKEVHQLGNVQTYSVVNPIVSAVSQCKMTVKGLGGLNLDRGITLDKRFARPDSIGLRAMPSVYTGTIGIVQQTPIEPNIVGPRGYFKVCENKEEVDKLSAKNLLSPTELMTPGTTEGDDGQRVFLNYMQKGHVQGISNPTPLSISNGYDEMIAYQAKEFCHTMKKDGVVTKVTPDFVFVKYDDGTEDAFKLDQVERHAAKAKYLDNTMTLMKNIKVGQKLKAQDPIAYNRNMFVEYKGKPIYCAGCVMNVLFMSAPEVYEDATIISEKASERLSSYVQKEKIIKVSCDTIVKDYKSKLYEKVKATDVIFSHALMTVDDALNDLLTEDSLDSSLIKEKHAGVSGQIKAINVYYCCKKEELSSSMKRFINAIEAEYKARGDAELANMKMGQFDKERNSRLPVQVPEGTKVANRKIYKGDVIIEYIIQAYSKMSHSDKVTYFNALKGETSKVLPEELMPVGVITGTKVDCIMSPTSPMKRKVMSIIKVGATERLMYEMMRKAKAIYEKGKNPKSIADAKALILKALLVAEGGDPKKAKNYINIKEELNSMSDKSFVDFINTGIIRINIVPTEYGLELIHVTKALNEVVGIPLEERVTIPFLYNDPELGPIISDKKQMILRIPVIKLMQTAWGENRYISSIQDRDKTNQVVNKSKGGGISDVETSMLLGAGYEDVVKEFFTFRADNDIAKKEAYANIVTSGRTNIPEAPDEGKVALKYITACYVGMGINPEFKED